MPNSIRHSISNNLGLKIIALAFAVVLWLAVARDPQAVVAVDVPVEFDNIPPDMEISSPEIPRIQIRLRGPERIVRRLQPSDVYAALELQGQRPGERTFDINAHQIHQPAGLDVVQVVPSQIQVSFDLRDSRRVDVRPRVIGTFVQGYRISKVVATPSTVEITGPGKHVDAIDSAITDPIDVSGAMNNIIVRRNAYVSDPLIQVTNSEPVQITIYIDKLAAEGANH